MLYLMMEKSNDKFFVKVGESRSPKTRRKTYKTHNPTAIMRSTCAGTASAEKASRVVLDKLGKRLEGSEWYEVNEAVFNKFYLEGLKVVRPNQSPIKFIEEF